MPQIVVGIDGSESSSQALEWALDEAERRQARLQVVHAWDAPFEPTWGTMGSTSQNMNQPARRLTDDEVAARVPDTTRVPVDKLIVRGSAAATLVDLSKDADLVVVGSRGHGGFAGLHLGSVSQQVAQHAQCPIVIVHSR